jgi:hypothetical protein
MEGNLDQGKAKKGFFAGLIDWLDRKMKEKASSQCCCCGDKEKTDKKSCCN